MDEATPFIHDIYNKVTILYTVAYRLEHGLPVDCEKLRATLGRVEELLSSLYHQLNEKPHLFFKKTTAYEFNEFISTSLEKLQKMFPETQFIYSYLADSDLNFLHMTFEKSLFYQILENAIENSFNANATKVEFTLHNVNNLLVFKIIDNGTGSAPKAISSNTRSIPNGIGKKIIFENTKKLNGQCIYSDSPNGGVTVTFSFPFINSPS